MRKFHIVVAVDSKGGIGKNGALAWRLPGDMAFFKRLTTEVKTAGKFNAVVMGRKTWDSIPAKFRPLKDRVNIVVTRQADLQFPSEVVSAASLDEAIKAADCESIETIFVIGGGAIYAESMEHAQLDRIYLTDVRSDFQCDTFFPSIGDDFVPVPHADSEVICENGTEYQFRVLRRNTTEVCEQSSSSFVINQR